MRLTRKQLQEIEVRDRSKAAVHEYGRALVLQHHGFEASPCISRTFTSEPLEEKLWIFKTLFFPNLATPFQRRQIAIAGYLAERIWEEGDVEDSSIGDLCWELEFNMGESFADAEDWTRSDWTGAQGWTESDVAVVHDILIRNWSTLIEGATALALDALSDGQCGFHSLQAPTSGSPEPQKNILTVRMACSGGER